MGRAGTHVEPGGDGPDGAIDAANGSLDHVTGPDKVVVDVRLPAHGDLSLACAKKCAHPRPSARALVSSRTLAIAKVSSPEPCRRHTRSARSSGSDEARWARAPSPPRHRRTRSRCTASSTPSTSASTPGRTRRRSGSSAICSRSTRLCRSRGCSRASRYRAWAGRTRAWISAKRSEPRDPPTIPS